MDRTAQLTARPASRAIAYDPPAPPGRAPAAATGTGRASAAPAEVEVEVEVEVGQAYAVAAGAAGAPARGPRARAARVLEENWTGTSTVPSRGLYPHQWSWDSAFIAIGLRHLSPLRAQTELETLLSAQWGDGRIPHIVFNPSVPLDAYFPSPDFWHSSTAGHTAGAPRTVQTSGIVQPPVHALAAWLVHCADPELSRSRGFLARAYPRLAAWHRYLLHRRDLGGGSLAAVVHPWEQGMDNSPCWDVPLARVRPAPARSFRRADLDHGAAEDRPTDLDYGRYVRLAADYRDAGYADGGGAFAVEDPAFNALLIASEHALARIAGELGAAGTARHARAERLTGALVDRLWDPAAGLFRCRDLRDGTAPDGRLVGGRSVAGLIPLLLPALPGDIAGALVRTLTGPHFGLGTTTRLVPSYDLLGESFDPHRYWRGPAWFNTGWLLQRGLALHGERSRARALRRALVETADATGHAEYVDPYTGEPCGATGFSWTAALTLDLLHGGGTFEQGGATASPGGTTVAAPGGTAVAARGGTAAVPGRTSGDRRGTDNPGGTAGDPGDGSEDSGSGSGSGGSGTAGGGGGVAVDRRLGRIEGGDRR
ncbi:MGH1-like glycoside hydrolase domain-containing protein [Streptomyces sp. MS06]|uniref:MGH1-like glycoside hydrolase domain-containing protein n=1 Tax=Streptomyces sp. MS06 TaxID=3385974 RepID=UPI00399F9BE4